MFVDILVAFFTGFMASCIGLLITLAFIAIVLPMTKTTFWITGTITFSILLYGLSTDYHSDSYYFSNAVETLIILLGACIGVVAFFIFLDKIIADKCPHCGSWNRGKWLEIKYHDSWDSLDDVEVTKDIYNNNGKKIGYIKGTEKELVNHSITSGTRKCSKCGGEYEATFKE